MAMFEINTNPMDRQLRQFGLICVIAFPLIVWMWSTSATALVTAAIVGMMMGGLGLAAPRLLKPVFIGLILVTFPVGLLVGELILLLIYFGVFLPMALLFRIIGRDALLRRASPEAETFWKPRIPPRSIRKYYQQS